MAFIENNESSLARLILSELSRLSQEVKRDTKERNAVKKYLSQMKKAYEGSDTEGLNRLLLKQTKDQLLTLYPSARETLEKLLIDVKRRSEQVFSSLFNRFEEYCENEKISLRGKMPKAIIDHLLEVYMDKKKHTAKIGIVFLKTLNWEKIRVTLDRERHRIWDREFNPVSFRDNLLNIHSDLLEVKPNPVEWVRLKDVYQSLKRQTQEQKRDWKKGGRLVAYYRDEFSADLSKFWKSQINQEIGPPHIEVSGIRDPRLSYKVVLPDGDIGSYGFMRPKREKI